MSLEDKIIKKLNSSFFNSNKNLVGIGDDCAYLNKEDLLISTDTFIENTHFDLDKSNPKQVAKKFFNANYSDLQCSGGQPTYCFLNISFSKNKSDIITDSDSLAFAFKFDYGADTLLANARFHKSGGRTMIFFRQFMIGTLNNNGRTFPFGIIGFLLRERSMWKSLFIEAILGNYDFE